MKISSRNQIAGTVTAIAPRALNATVRAGIDGGTIVTASFTEEAIAGRALAAGAAVTVIVKASDVLVGK